MIGGRGCSGLIYVGAGKALEPITGFGEGVNSCRKMPLRLNGEPPTVLMVPDGPAAPRLTGTILSCCGLKPPNPPEGADEVCAEAPPARAKSSTADPSHFVIILIPLLCNRLSRLD